MNMLVRRMALGLLMSCGALAAHAQVSLPAPGVTVTQDFNALPASGSATWSNNSTLPGWFHARIGTGTTIVANDGLSNSGNLYSYGTGTATERALGSLGSGNAAVGSLFWGMRLQNDTGETITSLTVSYTGEQWRNSAAAAQTIAFSYLVGSPTVDGSLAEFQSPGVAVPTLDFTSPITGGTAGALDGNATANRTTLTFTMTGLDIPPGTEVMLRWSDPDHTGSDHGLSIDDVSVTPNGGGGGLPELFTSSTSAAEGDSGITPFFFVVSLNQPAGPGGVTFDYATADDTASAGSDYAAKVASATIAEGTTSTTIHVDVNGDAGPENDETFFVNISNVIGAIALDTQGIGTIANDDVVITPIHGIQGSGATSPIVGSVRNTEGIVTGRKSNGFFLQTTDIEADSDPLTSQGIFVFTAGTPPVSAAVGNRVQVRGSVAEFVPSADLGQLPLTQLAGGVSVLLLTVGNPLPTPVQLAPVDPDGALDQLERYEGMRVTAPSFTVVAPTGGSTNEPNATGTTNGIFNVVVTGTPRPFREPGIQFPDSPPSGTIPPIPQWDFNPELLTVVSRAIGGTAIDVGASAQIENLIGPLDYGFRRYTIDPDPAVTPTITPAPAPAAARLPTADEFTVASYNMERFFDIVADPDVDDPVLTPAAFANRLNKASLAIRDYLNAPDILGVIEMENLATLQAVADKVNDDAVAAGQPDPQYVAYLQEGNDVGGIDVGFLVKSAEVVAGIDRVEVVEVTQLGLDETWTEPDGDTALLNDRPPLQLDAVVHYADGREFPITAIVVHQRSLNGAEDATPDGDRVRAKRQRQAEYLAEQIQAMQTADPDRRITVLGDFNAFEFNDGLVDAMNVVTGTPTPDPETAVTGDGVDLVNPDLLNLYIEEPADQRYSFVFDGNAQSLDHILINQALGASAAEVSLSHARINADYPEVNRNDANSPSRLSDHDPAMMYVRVQPLAIADLGVGAFGQQSPVPAGSPFSFTASLTNTGPNIAEFPAVGFALDAEIPDLVVEIAAGGPVGSPWICDAPSIDAGTTTVACTTDSLDITPPFSMGPFFAVRGTMPSDRPDSTLNLTVVADAQSSDPDEGNNVAQASIIAMRTADMSVAIGGASTIPRVRTPYEFPIVIANAGPNTPPRANLRVRVSKRRETVSLIAPAGWSCVTSATRLFEANCTSDSPPATDGSVQFGLQVIAAGRLEPPRFTIEALVFAEAHDPQPVGNVALKRVTTGR